jgi:hypothetical protein
VTNIGSTAFLYCTHLTNLTIPGGVTNIGNQAFEYCASLAGVYFKGNPPGLGSDVFTGDSITTVYYLPATASWGTLFGTRPTKLWNPQFQVGGASFGVRTNRFGFTVTGTANIPIVLEACTNLGRPVWQTLQSCTLTNGSLYFSDSNWTNYPARLYRIRSP